MNKKILMFIAVALLWGKFPSEVIAQSIPGNSESVKGNANSLSEKIFQDKLLDGSAGPKMITIPSGKFMMGDLQQVGQSYEKPVHEVTISKSFSMGIYPVTFDEYDKFTSVTGKAPVDAYTWGRGSRPVLNINLKDAQEYTDWLSKQTGHQYRLPSEAEWEYAARAGTRDSYPWGNDIGQRNANCSRCGSEWDRKMTAPVGQFPPNPWGLYDMLGNIWELTSDCWNYTYENAPTDGSVWRSGDCTRSVLRGGSWGDPPIDIRSSTRLRSYSGTRTIVIGFRLVREN